MKEEREEVKLVPCSQCSAPVLPNLAECMFCGQKDPGRLASTPVGEQFVNMRNSLRHRLRSERPSSPQIDIGTPLEKLQDYLAADDRSYIHIIIAASVLLFMLSMILGGNGLYRLGISGAQPLSGGRIWTLLSSLFLHANFMHLLFNLIWVYTLGPVVVQIFGRAQFFVIYTLGGITGVLTSVALGTPLTVGASAAVFGLIGAILYASWREGNAPQSIAPQLFIYTLLMIMLGTMTSLIDNWAHLGGLVGGGLAAFAIVDYPRNRFASWVYEYAAIAALIGSAMALVISILVPV